MHKNIEKLILKSFENKLTQQEQRELDQHLLTCTSCNALFEAYKRDDMTLSSIFKDKKLSPGFNDNLAKAISNEVQRKTTINVKKSIFKMSFSVSWGIAAVLLLVIVNLATYFYFGQVKGQSTNHQRNPIGLSKSNTSNTDISKAQKTTTDLPGENILKSEKKEIIEEKQHEGLSKENEIVKYLGSYVEPAREFGEKSLKAAKSEENVNISEMQESGSKDNRLDRGKGVKIKCEGFKEVDRQYSLLKSTGENKNYYIQISFPGKVEVNKIVIDTGYWNYKGEKRPGMYKFQILYNNVKYDSWRVLKTYNENKLFHLEIKETVSTDKIKIVLLPVVVNADHGGSANIYVGFLSNLEVYGGSAVK